MSLPTTFVAVNVAWLQELDELHRRCHGAPHDIEDTVMVALTKQDYCLLLTSIDALVGFHPCLEPELLDLTGRLTELREAQKGDWFSE